MTSTVPTTTDEALIREVITDRIQGMHDRDPERVLAAYLPDVVQYILAPPLRYTGFDVEGVRSWMSGFAGPIGLEIRDLELSVGGDVAFAHCLNAMRATAVGAPSGFELWIRTTVGLRKVEGQWRIAHFHESVPFHMEMGPDGSFRAATDLRP